MSITKAHPRKAPTENPVDFYKSKQQGGAHGKPTSIPQQLQGGPMREPLMGRKNLGNFK